MQLLSHYNSPIPREYKGKAGLRFSKSTPRQRQGIKVTFVEAVELQGRGSTSSHHFPHRGEGQAVRIKNNSDLWDDTSGIGESKQLNIFTSLNITRFLYALYQFQLLTPGTISVVYTAYALNFPVEYILLTVGCCFGMSLARIAYTNRLGSNSIPSILILIFSAAILLLLQTPLQRTYLCWIHVVVMSLCLIFGAFSSPFISLFPSIQPLCRMSIFLVIFPQQHLLLQ